MECTEFEFVLHALVLVPALRTLNCPIHREFAGYHANIGIRRSGVLFALYLGGARLGTVVLCCGGRARTGLGASH